MNAFFDISEHEGLPQDSFQLNNLGNRRISASIGTKIRGDWGNNGYQTRRFYADVTTEDYDREFIYKALRMKPVYYLDRLVNHHFNYYLNKYPQGREEFLKHMRYVILPQLKSRKGKEVYAELFEQWIKEKATNNATNNKTSNNVINNTIHIGSISAPTQFQQNSEHAVQSQNNQYQKEEIKEALELIGKDIQKVDAQIRNDFALELNYALVQLEKKQ